MKITFEQALMSLSKPLKSTLRRKWNETNELT